MKKPVRIGGKVIDWRDSSSFDVVVTSNSSVFLYVRPEMLPTTISVDWGDGKYNNYVFNTFPNPPSFVWANTHTYAAAGVYKIKVKTTANLAGLSCTNCSRYNAGYSRLFEQLTYVLIEGGTSNQSYNEYLGTLNYLYITVSPIKLDLSKLRFSPEIQALTLAGNLPNISGVIRFPDQLTMLQRITFYANNASNVGIFSFEEIFRNTLACRSYNFQYFSRFTQVAASTDLSEIARLIETHDLIDEFIMLAINNGIHGDGSKLFKNLFERPENRKIYISGAPAFTLELGVQANDFYSHEAKILYINNVTGDVSKFEWRYNAVTYIRIDPILTAYGSLNKIANVRQQGISQLAALDFHINNSKNVSLDVVNISHLRFNALGLSGGDNLSGDISTLVGNCQYCLIYTLSGITSTTITGWREYLTGIYGKRMLYPTSPKTFNCPNVMKAILTGIYQAPAGFDKLAADGNPTSDREMIYVLVNNYNWTFTNI